MENGEIPNSFPNTSWIEFSSKIKGSEWSSRKTFFFVIFLIQIISLLRRIPLSFVICNSMLQSHVRKVHYPHSSSRFSRCTPVVRREGICERIARSIGTVSHDEEDRDGILLLSVALSFSPVLLLVAGRFFSRTGPEYRFGVHNQKRRAFDMYSQAE